MILVDDSGWGCLLGGVMIGVYNTDTKKFKSRLIPVSYFQGNTFKQAKYRYYAATMFLFMWSLIGSKEEIKVCRGTVLDGIYDFLINQNWSKKLVKRCEIGDPLQSLLEEKFAQSLMRVGVPRVTEGAHCLSFNDQLKWIKEDKRRVRYVKTGWNSWKTKYSKEM